MVERDQREHPSSTRLEPRAAASPIRQVPRSRVFALRPAAIAVAVLLAIAIPQPVHATDGTAAPAVGEITFRLPFEPGRKVRVSQAWHAPYSHVGRSEFAYDFALAEGSPVLAAAPGVVSHAHAGETGCGGRDMVNAVNFVTIDHADGTATLYGHLSEVDVRVGDVVDAGQPIGLAGRTGFTNCAAHLHFARQVGGRAVTQSLPVSFAEYPGEELVHDQLVTAAAATIEVTNEADLAAEMATRLAAIASSHGSDGADEFTPWEGGDAPFPLDMRETELVPAGLSDGRSDGPAVEPLMSFGY